MVRVQTVYLHVVPLRLPIVFEFFVVSRARWVPFGIANGWGDLCILQIALVLPFLLAGAPIIAWRAPRPQNNCGNSVNVCLA